MICKIRVAIVPAKCQREVNSEVNLYPIKWDINVTLEIMRSE